MTRADLVDLVESVGGTVQIDQVLIHPAGRLKVPAVTVTLGRQTFRAKHATLAACGAEVTRWLRAVEA